MVPLLLLTPTAIFLALFAYRGNHSWPTRRTALERLVRNNPTLGMEFDRPEVAIVLGQRHVTTRELVVDARRRVVRRWTAELLAVVSALTLLVVPTTDVRRSRHGIDVVATN